MTSRTFHNLSAGSTTIMQSGKVIKFGGRVEAVEGGTKVGRGTYTTSDDAEISWLVGLTKMPIPQVWEEVAEADVAMPAAVAAGAPADAAKVAEEVKELAVKGINPAVTAAEAKLANPNAAAVK